MTKAAPEIANAFHTAPPPAWALRRHKSVLQHVWDFVGAPARMALLPDHQSEQLGLTSLRAERLRMVLPELQGRVLDIGCGDNMLLRLYKNASLDARTQTSVGADIHQWSDDVHVITNAADTGFPDASFDTVAFIACLNHIPERADALKEAHRILAPGGRVVATMIGSFIGKIGHAIWWYSEDKQRELHPDELDGLDAEQVLKLMTDAGFEIVKHERFGYGLNNLFVARKI